MKELVQYIQKRRLLLDSLFVAVLLTWGYKMTNFVLTYDEEAPNIKEYMIKGQMECGRPILSLVSIFIPISTKSLWETFIFSVILGFSALLICYAVFIATQKESIIAEICFVILFVSMPCHLYLMMYSFVSIQSSLAWLSVSIGLVFYAKNINVFNRKYVLLSILCFWIAIGIYQTFFATIFLCGLFIVFMKLFFDTCYRRIAKSIISLCLEITISIILHFISVKVCQIIFLGTNGYSEGYFAWGHILLRKIFYR